MRIQPGNSSDEYLHQAFSWLARIGACPKFGSRPIGWYQMDAALFTTDPHPPSGADYVDSGRSGDMFSKLSEEFIAQAKADCAKFESENAALLEQAGDFEQNGMDFWYTRNGHGVGFWDRGYPDEVADPLTEAAHKFGEVYDLQPEDLCQCEECLAELEKDRQ
jgi:hypothetical protein